MVPFQNRMLAVAIRQPPPRFSVAMISIVRSPFSSNFIVMTEDCDDLLTLADMPEQSSFQQ